MLRNPCEHAWAYFLVIVKGEYIVRPTRSLKDSVRATRLTLNTPANAQKGRQDAAGFRRWPLAHGVTAKTLLIWGTGSL
jgi:hypothetical protein